MERAGEWWACIRNRSMVQYRGALKPLVARSRTIAVNWRILWDRRHSFEALGRRHVEEWAYWDEI